MRPQFQFFGFDPDEDLRKDAARRLDRLLDISPYGTMAVALLEKLECGFRCAINLYTPHGPFVAESHQDSALEALLHVSKTLTTRIENWREERSRYIRERKAPIFLEPLAS